jgi:hypothetical protein
MRQAGQARPVHTLSCLGAKKREMLVCPRDFPPEEAPFLPEADMYSTTLPHSPRVRAAGFIPQFPALCQRAELSLEGVPTQRKQIALYVPLKACELVVKHPAQEGWR